MECRVVPSVVTVCSQILKGDGMANYNANQYNLRKTFYLTEQIESN